MFKRLIFLFFCCFPFVYSSGQSIQINATFYNGVCSGQILNVPVTLSEEYNSNSSFTLRLEKVFQAEGEVGNTILIQSQNNTSPLIFKLPEIFSVGEDDFHNYSLKIESSNPSSTTTTSYVQLKTLPSIELGYPIENDSLRNDYWNPNERPKLLIKLLNSRNTSSKLFSNSSDNPFFISNWQREIWLNEIDINKPFFKVDSIINSCGKGKIIGLNRVELKRNDFRIKIVGHTPKTICEDKNLNIWIDYDGIFENDNKFYLEVADRYGNILISSEVFEHSSKHFIFSTNSIAEGYYKLRIRGTSPQVASKFVDFSIKPKPTIKFQWLSDLSDPIGYLNPIQLRVEYTNELNLKDVDYDRTYEPLSIKLSNGYFVNNFTAFSGFENGFLKDIQDLRLAHSQFITIDSINSACGQITDFNVVGDRFISVSNSTYINELEKLDYCVGENVVVYLESTNNLNSSSVITVELYNQSSTKQVNAEFIDFNKISFTIPPGYKHGDELSFRVICANPNFQSAPYRDKLRIKKKLEIVLQRPDYNYYATNPSVEAIYFTASGAKPNFIVYAQNGIEKSTTFFGTENYSNYNSYFRFNICKQSDFTISQTQNECGVLEYSPPLSFSFDVLNPKSKAIFLSNDEIVLLPDSQFVISIDTVGFFHRSDIFVASITTITNGQTNKLEVARGNGLELVANIPHNITLEDYVILTITSELTEVENLELSTRSKVLNIRKIILPHFASIYTEQGRFQNFETNLNGKKVFKAVSKEKYSIQIASDLVITELEINSIWHGVEQNTSQINNSLYFSFIDIILEKDTTFVISKFKTKFGEIEYHDSLNILSKDFRIKFSLVRDLSKIPIVCQGTYVDLNYDIEGTSNYTDNFEVYFVTWNSILLTQERFKAEIISKNNNLLRVRVPEMPWEHSFKIEIESSFEKDRFVNSTNLGSVIIGKKHEVFLSSVDGNDFAWTRGFYADSQRPYVTTLNSKNPYWTGKIFSLESKFSEIETIDKQFQKLWVDVPLNELIRIQNVESTCGYGIVTGTFILKKCDQSLYLNSYTPQKSEFYSSDFIISSEQTSYEGQLYSAKKYIILRPGFESSKITNFKAVIEGCTSDE